jgi:hypothetical protein
VHAADVAVLAALVREHYAADGVDTGGTESTLRRVAQRPDFEPYRSFRLVDAATVGHTLVITFTWDDGAVFLMPFDARDVEVDMTDNIGVTTFLSHHLEFTLGGPRESWGRARATPFGPRFSVVRPYGQG